MEKSITKLELLKQYKRFTYCLYYSRDNTLFKNCEQSKHRPAFLAERLYYVNDLSPLEGYSHPISILKDENEIEEEEVYGYEMPYYENAKSFFDLVYLPDKVFNSTLSFEEKKTILLKMHETLRNLNKDYIIGDINLQNLLLTNEGQGVFIDWENGRPVDSFFSILALYFINDKWLLQDDALKLFIASLSLIYGINFESFVMDYSFNHLFDFQFQRPIMDYLSNVIIESTNEKSTIVYFDEFLNHLKEPSIIEKHRIKQRAINYQFKL